MRPHSPRAQSRDWFATSALWMIDAFPGGRPETKCWAGPPCLVVRTIMYEYGMVWMVDMVGMVRACMRPSTTPQRYVARRGNETVPRILGETTWNQQAGIATIETPKGSNKEAIISPPKVQGKRGAESL